MQNQTFEISCPGGHSFEYKLSLYNIQKLRGIKRGSIHGVKCTECNKSFKIDIVELVKFIQGEENLIVPEATIEATVEENVKGKKVKKVVGLKNKIIEKLLSKKLQLPQSNVVEYDAVGLNADTDNLYKRKKALHKPTPNDTTGIIDTTG
jgi:hypothetical protein